MLVWPILRGYASYRPIVPKVFGTLVVNFSGTGVIALWISLLSVGLTNQIQDGCCRLLRLLARHSFIVFKVGIKVG